MEISNSNVVLETIKSQTVEIEITAKDTIKKALEVAREHKKELQTKV